MIKPRQTYEYKMNRTTQSIVIQMNKIGVIGSGVTETKLLFIGWIQ